MKTDNYIIASCTINHNTVHKNGEQVFANKDVPVADFFLSLYKELKIEYPRFYKMDNLSKLGWLASEILLKDSFSANNYQPEQTGLLFCNANASIDTDIKYQATIDDIPSPSVFVYTLPNIMIGEICIRNHFKGESAFFVFEKFDAEFVEQYVNNLLNNDILKACICGWVELVGNEYKAALYLVEKNGAGNPKLFNSKNMYALFEGENIK
ncbi:MAG: hypothetical protein V4539_19650 [Bacteroidota bacterium]